MNPIGFDKKKADKVMEKQGIDALLLFSPINVFYTTGMPVLVNDVIPLWGIVTRSFPTISIVPRDSDPILAGIVNAARDAQIHSWVSDFRSYSSRNGVFEVIRKFFEERGLLRGIIAIDEITPAFAYDSLQNCLKAATLRMVGDDILDELKMVKSVEEIRRLKKAGEIGQKAILAAIDDLKEDCEIIALIKRVKSTVIEEGGTGWNHTNIWCERPAEEDKAWFSKLHKGDIIHFDIGAVYHGYSSDLRRTAILGKVPLEVERIYELILESSDKCMKNIMPGVKLSDIYRQAHDDLTRAGYDGTFGWSIGHSIGIGVEEPPLIRPDSVERFEPNMAFCMEMWYLVKPLLPTFGIGVEDTGIITEKGFERFTNIDRFIYVK